MKYKQILVHMQKLKSYPYWNYATPWTRLCHDPVSEKIFLTQRLRYTQKTSWMGIEDSKLIITPEDMLILPESEISGVVLGTLGIAGRFRTKTNGITHRRYYQHECMTNYEAICGLQLNFKTGKPLNAKRIDQLIIDPVARKEIDLKVQELRTVFLGAARLKGAKFERNWNLVEKQYMRESVRDRVIINALARRRDEWVNNVINSLHYFAASTKYVYNTPTASAPIEPSLLFDKMFNFHKSAVYRHFKVVT
jgi:hypothetical protein